GGVSVPWHLTTLEFLTTLKQSMAAEGVYVMNVIDYPPFRFARAEIATLGRLFDNIAVITLDTYLNGERGGNIVIVASDTAFDTDAIAANLRTWRSPSTVVSGAALDEFVGETPILTDDFAPVDQMIDVPLGSG
ncbi:MAG: fused MFS/spermidine synthase, partial [Acidimicrobiia bacterium]|nr:fused MFS/spermidine synthase [Acidimicrobiia bacterium]